MQGDKIRDRERRSDRGEMNGMEKRTFREIMLDNFETRRDRTALADSRNPDGITYGELDDISGRVCAWLKQKGIGREQFVMISMPRGLEAVAACIGVWRAGAAYTITEEGYPRERVEYICRDCGCALTLNSEIFAEMMKCGPAEGWNCSRLSLRPVWARSMYS